MTGKIVILWGGAALCEVLRAAFRRGTEPGSDIYRLSVLARPGCHNLKRLMWRHPAASVRTLCARTRQAELCVTNKVSFYYQSNLMEVQYTWLVLVV
ncbi:MAG: hypothetical protein K2P87_17170 [Lachnospiraceae bacterium]|nr:hypothetical protein [Lachnospiraceae bacterium]